MAAKTFDAVDGDGDAPGAHAVASTTRGRRIGVVGRPAVTGGIHGRRAGTGAVATRGSERRATAFGEP